MSEQEKIAQKILAYYGEGISKARYVAREIRKIMEKPKEED